MEKITVYKNVFSRENPATIFTFDDYLFNPDLIFKHFRLDLDTQLNKVIHEADKTARNVLKRELLPAMDASPANIFALDIDDVQDYSNRFGVWSERLLEIGAYCVKESVSGNIVAFFRYSPDISVSEYPFVYYKKYLETTLALGVNIDFLPEINRLRYVGAPGVLAINDNAPVLTEGLHVGQLPTINTHVTPTEARKRVYKSL